MPWSVNFCPRQDLVGYQQRIWMTEKYLDSFCGVPTFQAFQKAVGLHGARYLERGIPATSRTSSVVQNFLVIECPQLRPAFMAMALNWAQRSSTTPVTFLFHLVLSGNEQWRSWYSVQSMRPVSPVNGCFLGRLKKNKLLRPVVGSSVKAFSTHSRVLPGGCQLRVFRAPTCGCI